MTTGPQPQRAQTSQLQGHRAGRAPTHQEWGVAGDSDSIDQGLLLQQAKGAPCWWVQPQRLFEDLRKSRREMREVRRSDATCPRPISAPITVLNVHLHWDWGLDTCTGNLTFVFNLSCDERTLRPRRGVCKTTTAQQQASL